MDTITSKQHRISLEVLIATHGEDGLLKIAQCDHPQEDGVRYLISWQIDSDNLSIPQSLQRSDIRILISKSKGLAANRNNLLKNASAPIILFSDNDVIYQPHSFTSIIAAFQENLDADFLLFKFSSDNCIKQYPESVFDFPKLPKSYYPSSIEIAGRRERLDGLRFDESYYERYHANEELLFLASAEKKGLKIRFIPLLIAFHQNSTTGTRNRYTDKFIEAKGAAIFRLYPFTWPLRLTTHLLRNYYDQESTICTKDYIRAWTKGTIWAATH